MMAPHAEPSSQHPAHPRTEQDRTARRTAFTLIELLVVIAIIGILFGLAIAAVAKSRNTARRTREVSAARQLMVAYHLEADENRGHLMPAKTDSTVEGVLDETGRSISPPATMRWPHRLRPWLSNRFRGVIFVNHHEQIYDILKKSGKDVSYQLSVYPAFGMNGGFVGTQSYSYAGTITDVPVRTLTEAEVPQRLVVFVSAINRENITTLSTSFGLSSNDEPGHFQVEAPFRWKSENPSGIGTNPALDSDYGYVAFRWAGKATVSFLDGHVELIAAPALRDMRLWSNEARRQDRENYAPAL